MSEVKVWRYVIPPCKKGELEPHDEGQWWGVFLIDSSGMFTAVTDAGNYSYWWSHHGRDDFRRFLLELKGESQYMLQKLCGSEKEYDDEETFKQTKLEIFRLRRNKTITEEQARSFLKELKLYNNLGMESDFNEWYYSSEGSRKIDASEVFNRRYPCQAYYFINKIFKRLQDRMREELNDVSQKSTLCTERRG